MIGLADTNAKLDNLARVLVTIARVLIEIVVVLTHRTPGLIRMGSLSVTKLLEQMTLPRCELTQWLG